MTGPAAPIVGFLTPFASEKVFSFYPKGELCAPLVSPCFVPLFSLAFSQRRFICAIQPFFLRMPGERSVSPVLPAPMIRISLPPCCPLLLSRAFRARQLGLTFSRRSVQFFSRDRRLLMVHILLAEFLVSPALNLSPFFRLLSTHS